MSRRPSTSETVAQGQADAMLEDPVPHLTAEGADAPISQLARRPSRHRLRLLRGRRRFLWRLRGDRFTVTGQS